MTVFRINLIRNRPVPLPQRKSVALPLLLYLAAAGGAMVWSINQGVRDVLAVRQQQQQTATELALFAQQHPSQPDVVSYIAAMRGQLVEAEEKLGAAEQLLVRRTPAANLLYALTTSIPQDVRLLNLDLTLSDQTMHFQLAIPVEQEGAPTDTTKLLQIWDSTPEVRNYVSDIREESSRQMEFDGHQSFLVRFAATLKGGG